MKPHELWIPTNKLEYLPYLISERLFEAERPLSVLYRITKTIRSLNWAVGLTIYAQTNVSIVGKRNSHHIPIYQSSLHMLGDEPDNELKDSS